MNMDYITETHIGSLSGEPVTDLTNIGDKCTNNEKLAG